jgi:uncharacterized membrane-anchored protein
MPLHRSPLVAVLLALVPLTAFAQIAPNAAAPLTAEQRRAEVKRLSWTTGTQSLAQSKSTLALPDGFQMVRDADAIRLNTLVNGTTANGLEAIVRDNKSVVYFYYADAGYVTDDDWSSVDPAAMIEQIKSGTEQDNTERQNQGLPALHVTGWLQQPVFDKATNTVHWAIQAESAGGSLVNAITLKLNRYGYERINWATDLANYTPTGGTADIMLAAQNFDTGARYEDHVSADNVAGYGIGALVATVAGVKLAKVFGLGALLLLGKKFLVVIIAGCAAAFSAVKRFLMAKKRS